MLFLYGENDWMDSSSATAVLPSLQACMRGAGRSCAIMARARCGCRCACVCLLFVCTGKCVRVDRTQVPARLKIVPRAGHQLFVDNPTDFNAAVRDGLAELDRRR